LALRPGVQHSARETQFNFERVIPMAQRLSAAGPKAPIVARLDSGFDSTALMREMESYNAAGVPQLDWLIKVRREVAYIIVSPTHEVGDETGCSVSRSLPVHASLATVACEATGTKYRAFGPRRLPRGSGVICQHRRGWDARLSGMVNRGELLQASLVRTSQRC
jgi:IS5 family transposase